MVDFPMTTDICRWFPTIFPRFSHENRHFVPGFPYFFASPGTKFHRLHQWSRSPTEIDAWWYFWGIIPFSVMWYTVYMYILYTYTIHHFIFRLCIITFIYVVMLTWDESWIPCKYIYIYVNYDNINKTIEQHMYICIFIYKYQYKQTA
jgi:hypothetical protein